MSEQGKPHPFDVRSLQKGSFITVEELEDVTGLKKHQPEYVWALQTLREWIYRESKRNGYPLSCGIEGDQIHIHTDSEAAEYHRRLHYEAIGRMKRSSRRMVETVTRSGLTEAEQRQYDREVALAALRCQRIRQVGQLPAAEQKQITG